MMIIKKKELIEIVEDMSVMFVSDEEGSGRMEENRNRNVVPTQVYAVQEEVSKRDIPLFYHLYLGDRSD